MTDLMKQILERKRARRRALAVLPVGEKLRMLEEMIADTRAIVASQPPKPANPVRLRVHGKGNLGAKQRGEAVADILGAIKERRA
jgi:hypothetical protein